MHNTLRNVLFCQSRNKIGLAFLCYSYSCYNTNCGSSSVSVPTKVIQYILGNNCLKTSIETDWNITSQQARICS